ncbi:30S ribosomal protein S17 [Patescibacteria group bacterium]|nr:30S ribosomal protein S17 [Patescibacteria group bacterium]
MRTKKGNVISKSGAKTAVVEVHSYRTHPKYKKRYRVSKKYHAHDEENKAQVGDIVTISETKPISKLKRWRILPKGVSPEPKAEAKSRTNVSETE